MRCGAIIPRGRFPDVSARGGPYRLSLERKRRLGAGRGGKQAEVFAVEGGGDLEGGGAPDGVGDHALAVEDAEERAVLIVVFGEGVAQAFETFRRNVSTFRIRHGASPIQWLRTSDR